ncbi:hypothetical protein RIF29_12020 [Crotalaria pallida]|uniref:F-box domain-containing protein n=1 Tax=Crotalaria pallida TaxID=3830 RepID=A0AAN9P1D5_CROPI
MEPATTTKRAKQSENQNQDRLGDLPDCLIIHILTFVKCRDAARTCVLSKRWKHLYKRMSILLLNASDFATVKIFAKFVSKLLLHRDSSVALHTLDFRRYGVIETRILKKVLHYAVSNNVRRLGIDIQPDDRLLPIIGCSVFSCRSLTSLKLSVYCKNYSEEKIVFPESPDLPALTSLDVTNIVFCASSGSDRAEPFSNLSKLNNLFIGSYTLRDAKTLCVSSVTLSSLAFRAYCCPSKIVLSTPNLCSFDFSGVTCHDLSGSGLSAVKRVNIDADTSYCSSEPPFILLNWVKELVNVQSMMVTINTLQVLFLIPDLVKINFPSLGNLKSMKVKMKPLSCAVTESLGPFKSRKAQKMILLVIQKGSSSECSEEEGILHLGAQTILTYLLSQNETSLIAS